MMHRTRFLGTAVFLAVSALALPAFAAKKQEVINQFTVKAEEFTAKDTGKVLTSEIGNLKAFLQQAQSFLAQDEDEDLDSALAIVKAASEFIEAELALVDVEDQAAKAIGRAEAKEAEVAKVNDEIKALQKEREAVEAGGGK